LTSERSSRRECWIEPHLFAAGPFFAEIAEKAAIAPFSDRRHNLRKSSRLDQV
jgi:hypothetical protein